MPSSAQHSLDIPETSTPQACGVVQNDRIRSPTRVEVDSSLYLESPDDTLQPAVKRSSLFNYLLLVVFANTTVVFIKKKLLGDSDENFVDIVIFLGVINFGLAILYFVIPYLSLVASSAWTAISKSRPESPMEVTVSPPPVQPAPPPPREREAPPPPYHIAVDSSTPPPSYFDIFDK